MKILQIPFGAWLQKTTTIFATGLYVYEYCRGPGSNNGKISFSQELYKYTWFPGFQRKTVSFPTGLPKKSRDEPGYLVYQPVLKVDVSFSRAILHKYSWLTVSNT